MSSIPCQVKRPRRACILSGGGDAPGVNAVIRGFVHAAERCGVEVFGCRDGFQGLLDPGGISPLGFEHVRSIVSKGGSCLGCSTRVNPFYHPISGTDRTEDRGAAIIERLQALGIDVLVLIGGDGTMLAGHRLSDRGMPIIGVPKTIDNDLGETEITCGFDTALGTVVHAIDALQSTAESHSRVMIVEVMGRHAGWIALHAGIAGGADVILIPEIPYELRRIVAKIKQREMFGLRSSIVVIAEGARPVGGEVLADTPARPGHLAHLSGAGARLLRELDALDLGHEVRLTALGHLQRGGSPSAFNRRLGTEFGTQAAELCAQGEYGRMLAWRAGRVVSIPLPPPEALHKLIDPEGPAIRSARLMGIEMGQIDTVDSSRPIAKLATIDA